MKMVGTMTLVQALVLHLTHVNKVVMKSKDVEQYLGMAELVTWHQTWHQLHQKVVGNVIRKVLKINVYFYFECIIFIQCFCKYRWFIIFCYCFLATRLSCQSIVSKVNAANVGTFWTTNKSQYASGGTSISDGGNDMYDTGNCISIPATTAYTACSGIVNKVTYQRNCDESTVNGQSYAMSIKNDGISVLFFANYTQNTISKTPHQF